MGETTLGGKACLDPGRLRQQIQDRGLPIEFWGRANSYTNPLGRQAGRGWCLLTRKDFLSLELDSYYGSPVEFKINGEVVLKKAIPIRGTCCYGMPSDDHAPYLVEFVDWRYFALRQSSCGFQPFNVQSKTHTATDMSTRETDQFFTHTLHYKSRWVYIGGTNAKTTQAPPVFWTWQTLIDELWSFAWSFTHGASEDEDYTATALPVLSLTQSQIGYDPNNVIVGPGNPWDILNDVLEDKLQLAYRYDSTTNEHSYVDLASKDEQFAVNGGRDTSSVAQKLEDYKLLDYGTIEPAYANMPEFREDGGRFLNTAVMLPYWRFNRAGEMYGEKRYGRSGSWSPNNTPGEQQLAGQWYGGGGDPTYETNGEYETFHAPLGWLNHPSIAAMGSELQSSDLEAIQDQIIEDVAVKNSDNVGMAYNFEFMQCFDDMLHFYDNGNVGDELSNQDWVEPSVIAQWTRRIKAMAYNSGTMRRAYSGIRTLVTHSSLVGAITWREYQAGDYVTEYFGFGGVLRDEITRPISVLYPESYERLKFSRPLQGVAGTMSTFNLLRAREPQRLRLVLVNTALTDDHPNSSGTGWGHVEPLAATFAGVLTEGGGDNLQDYRWYYGREAGFGQFSNEVVSSSGPRVRTCLVGIKSRISNDTGTTNGPPDPSIPIYQHETTCDVYRLGVYFGTGVVTGGERLPAYVAVNAETDLMEWFSTCKLNFVSSVGWNTATGLVSSVDNTTVNFAALPALFT